MDCGKGKPACFYPAKNTGITVYGIVLFGRDLYHQRMFLFSQSGLPFPAGLFYFWGMIMRWCFLLFLLPFSPESSAQVKALEYQDVQDFRIHKADLQQVTIILNLRFYNPNHYSVDLKDGDIDVYFNDRLSGKAILDERTKVPARDTFLLPVTIVAPIDKIVTNALELLVNNEVLVRLEGTVKAGKRGIFIKIPVRYEGKQRIEL